MPQLWTQNGRGGVVGKEMLTTERSPPKNTTLFAQSFPVSCSLRSYTTAIRIRLLPVPQ